MKLVYRNSDGAIIAQGDLVGFTPPAGETNVNHPSTVIESARDKKVDLGALPTVTLINTTAGEKTAFDNDNAQADGTDIQTRYDTKGTDILKIGYLKDLAKLQADGTASKTAVAAL